MVCLENVSLILIHFIVCWDLTLMSRKRMFTSLFKMYESWMQCWRWDKTGLLMLLQCLVIERMGKGFMFISTICCSSGMERAEGAVW
jgi:hypothetical protein